MSKFSKYSKYINSPLWQDRHPDFLKQAGYRCMMLPWVKVGRKQRYQCHHTHYWENFEGKEQFWWDVLVLCPIAHWFIHRVLGGADRVRNQKTPYPNSLQSLAHAWCRVPNFLKPLVFTSPIALLILFYP